MRPLRLAFLLLLSGCATLSDPGAPRALSGFRQPSPVHLPDLFVWTDTCNVYVLRDGDSALLIDLGDASVLDHLAQLGIKQVAWVLSTNHHPEQCHGFPTLNAAKVVAPAPQAELF